MGLRTTLALAPLLTVSVLLGSVNPAVAGAQAPPSETDLESARAQFERGLAADAAGSYREAADAFAESVRSAPRFSNVWNLAKVRVALGEPMEAHALLTRLVNQEFGPLEAAEQQRALDLRETAEAAIATLSIGIEGAPRAAIRVNGEQVAIADGAEPISHSVDPGRHVVVARTPSSQVVERTVEVGPGESLEVSFLFESPQVAPPLGTGEDGREDGDEGLSPWPFVIGAALVAVAAFLIVWVVLNDDQELSANCDSRWGCVEL